MATGPALYPSSTTFPNTNVYPGQGNRAELVARVSFDSAQTSDPLTWVDVSSRVRSFSIERGGENELELIDTGTCTVVLDNRDRQLDPFNTSSSYSPNVKPRRRLWLQSQWDGDTIDQFYGWTGSFRPEWSGNTDAVVAVAAQDGFASLAGDALPVTSPPVSSYPDVVGADNPVGYWQLADRSGTVVAADAGPEGLYFAGATLNAAGLPAGPGGAASLFGGFTFLGPANPLADEAVVGNFEGKRYFTVESWVYPLSSLNDIFLQGPIPAAEIDPQWWLERHSDGVASFSVLSTAGGGTEYKAESAAAAVGDNAWYHIVGVMDEDEVRLYINGVLIDTTAATGQLAPDGVGPVVLNYDGPQGYTAAHVALYDYALSAGRIAVHYAAGLHGASRALANVRIDEVLDNSDVSFLPRRLRTASRQVEAVFYAGQTPKGELELASRTEGDPAVVFFAKDGAVVFLDRNHRTVSPWNTVQATFDDDGTDLPYLDGSLEIDDGEAFIYNDVRVTAAGGELQQSTDTTSIGEYQRQVLDRGETLNVTDGDADAEADALLAKYKDPLPRVTAFALHGGQDINHPGVLNQILEREIGDRVRIIRRPVGGGSAIDQTVFIRKISLSGGADGPYITARWSLAQR